MKNLDLSRYNGRVKDWTAKTLDSFKMEAENLGIEHRVNSPSKGSSVAKITARTREKDGAIIVCAFKIRRSLIYPHKGAGRGQAGWTGSKWQNRKGEWKKTSPKSYGKMDTGNRTAKPFINNVLDEETGVEELAYIVAEELGAAIINNLAVK